MTTDQTEQPTPNKPKPPSPYWWLLMFPIGGIAGSLSADYGPWPMVVGAFLMLALFRKDAAASRTKVVLPAFRAAAQKVGFGISSACCPR